MTKSELNIVEVEIRGGVLTPIKIPKGIRLIVKDLDVSNTSTYFGP